MYRSNPAIGLCFRALREGWLGEVLEAHAVMSQFDGDPYRRFLAGYPGGAMFNFGSHLIDLVVAMLGRPENVVAFWKETTFSGRPSIAPTRSMRRLPKLTIAPPA